MIEAHPAPNALTTEHLPNPVGIDVVPPGFSWQLPWTWSGAAQTAFQVVAAARPEELASGPWLWDSGQAAGGDPWCVWQGGALGSRQRVWWTVRAWDENGRASAWSEPAFFELGLLAAGEWSGPWQGVQGIGTPLFRSVFLLGETAAEMVRARWYIAAAGYYEARLNGVRIGERGRVTEYTDYWKRVVYQTYDVTAHLRQGENVMALALSGGYAERFGYTPPCFRAQLEVERRDGGRKTHGVSPAEWRAAPGPWRAADIYHGEHYDARHEIPGWDAPGFDERGAWQVTYGAHTAIQPLLVGVKTQPVRVTQELAPVARYASGKDRTILDFGQNFPGWARLKVTGPAGTTVTLRFAEEVKPDGSLDPTSNRVAAVTDRYTLSGRGSETWEPSFTYHGFRYVEVSGHPDLPADWSVTGCVAHTDLPRRGRFACSDVRLSRLWENVDWTLRGNAMSVMTDCPQRNERQGWLGDAHLITETLLHHFDARAFDAKWMDDIHDTQQPDGSRCSTSAPPWYLGGRAFPPHRFTHQADLIWTAAATLIPWQLYLHHGDRTLAGREYPFIRAHLDYLCRRPEFPLAPVPPRGSVLCDWLYPGAGTGRPDPSRPDVVYAAFLLRQLTIGAWLADLLGNRADQERFQEAARRTREAIQAGFYDAREHSYGSQTTDALALCFDFVPEGERQAVVEHLASDILDRCHGHLDTGLVGTPVLLEALSQNNRFDVAWQVVTAEGEPGWMEMLRRGATTMCERWNYDGNPEMNSRNHPALGAVSAWMFRWLAGIRVDPDAPGYRRFTLVPETPRGLSWVEAELVTPRGPIRIRWDRTADGIRYRCVVPPGCTAVFTPSGAATPQILTPGPHDLCR